MRIGCALAGCGTQGLAWLVAGIGAQALIGAWIFQYGFHILQCPLCLEQRYAYYLAIPLSALIALIARRAPRALIGGGLVVVALAMLINAGLGVYHSGVEWGWWAGPKDCTGPITELGKGGGSLLNQLNTITLVRCDEVQWRFLGLSLAGYNVLISLAMALLALLAAALAWCGKDGGGACAADCKALDGNAAARKSCCR